MRSILNYSLAVAIISSFVSCGGGHGHDSEHEGHGHEGHEHEAESAGDGCVLTYNSDSIKMSWTAYKTTEKIGVGGTFDDLRLEGVKEGMTAAQVFENAKFKIASASVNSNNPDRDKKISEHFFGTMAKAVEITGTVVEIGENHATVFIEMNGVMMKQKFDLKTDNATFCTIAADLNLENWNALESVNALNEICFDLHKGSDGESKLWTEVRVELTTQLDKNCP